MSNRSRYVTRRFAMQFSASAKSVLLEGLTKVSGGNRLQRNRHKNLYLEDSHENIVDILKNSRQPIISVCVTDQVQRLTADATLKKLVRSEKRVAAAMRSTRAS